MLDEGVVAQAQDIDLCLLLGAGWPFHLGGITPYLDREGISEKVTGQRFLPIGVASLPVGTDPAVLPDDAHNVRFAMSAIGRYAHNVRLCAVARWAVRNSTWVATDFSNISPV
ncbi:MAG: hypothetical protein WKF47_04875 [Geodermatophilaceae bacterium]